MMGDENNNNNGYDDKDDLSESVLEMCKLAQGNITTIHWCKTQIRKHLKVLDRLVERLKNTKETDSNMNEIIRIEDIIKKQTDSCKELGEKIQLEVESLEAIRIAAKSYGIDIKTRILQMDDALELGDDLNPFLPD